MIIIQHIVIFIINVTFVYLIVLVICYTLFSMEQTAAGASR